MRTFLLPLLFAAAPVAAQMPARTVTFDAASAFEQRYRASVEAAVFGRFTIGASASFAHDDLRGAVIVPPNADPCLPDVACWPAFTEGSAYRAFSIDLSARWYPRALSWRRGDQSAGLYLGEFIGYHHRTLRSPIVFGCPPEMLCAQGGADPNVMTMTGFEPGAEIGLRFMPTPRFVADVGGRFRLATFEDAFTRQSPGDVDARLVIGLGLRW